MHEVAQGYKTVTEETVYVKFRLTSGPAAGAYALVWTTTPWTLPSNTALAVGPNIQYVVIETFNPYTHLPVSVILAKDRMSAYFKDEEKVHAFEPDQKTGWKLVSEIKGSDLVGIRYEQLLPYQQPANGDAVCSRV